mgnify:CR=1 FL=1
MKSPRLTTLTKDSNVVEVKETSKPSESQPVDESSYLSLSQVGI